MAAQQVVRLIRASATKSFEMCSCAGGGVRYSGVRHMSRAGTHSCSQPCGPFFFLIWMLCYKGGREGKEEGRAKGVVPGATTRGRSSDTGWCKEARAQARACTRTHLVRAHPSPPPPLPRCHRTPWGARCPPGTRCCERAIHRSG